MANEKCNNSDDDDDNNLWPSWTSNGRPSTMTKTRRRCQQIPLIWLILGLFITLSSPSICEILRLKNLSSSSSSSPASMNAVVNYSSPMRKNLVKNNDTLIVSSPSSCLHSNSRHKHHREQTLRHKHHHKRRDTGSKDQSIELSKSATNSVMATNGDSTLRSYTTSNKSINFTHVELDSITGNIYVGASNWIFQLDSNTLRVEHAVRTGPIRDSSICPPSDCSGVDANLVQITNNVNKILLVEPYARMLIVCGSVHQGACTRHRLEDISQHEELIPLPVASNDENSSTIAFVGPARYFGVQLTPILYVAATDTRIGPYRDMVPAISGRSLESTRLFTIIDRGFADSARVDISSNIRDYFLVHYVYGFYANDYVYFAQVQRRSYLRTLEEMGYVTRLSRVCVSDAGFHTYTELTLECVNHYSSKSFNDHVVEQFNLLQDATIVKAGADLSDSFNIERGSLVLIGVFANSHDHTNRPNGGKSAVCVYPITDIEQRFAENIHLCYNGSVYSRNMDYIAGSVNQCPEPGV
ncbi:plexin B-like protein, partial [Euroglyphus maynei]